MIRLIVVRNTSGIEGEYREWVGARFNIDFRVIVVRNTSGIEGEYREMVGARFNIDFRVMGINAYEASLVVTSLG